MYPAVWHLLLMWRAAPFTTSFLSVTMRSLSLSLPVTYGHTCGTATRSASCACTNLVEEPQCRACGGNSCPRGLSGPHLPPRSPEEWRQKAGQAWINPPNSQNMQRLGWLLAQSLGRPKPPRPHFSFSLPRPGTLVYWWGFMVGGEDPTDLLGSCFYHKLKTAKM